jgi:hypothetical protein
MFLKVGTLLELYNASNVSLKLFELTISIVQPIVSLHNPMCHTCTNIIHNSSYPTFTHVYLQDKYKVNDKILTLTLNPINKINVNCLLLLIIWQHQIYILTFTWFVKEIKLKTMVNRTSNINVVHQCIHRLNVIIFYLVKPSLTSIIGPFLNAFPFTHPIALVLYE